MGDYEITRNGEIYSLKHNKRKLIKGYIDKYGYRRVLLHIWGKRKKYFVHRLVAMKYIENPNNLPQVNHKDGNKLNNNVENLEWVTAKQNIQHAIKNNLREANNSSKLNINQVKEIKKLFLTKSMKEIASMYNVSLSCIKHIHAGHTWKDI
nr:MAG TPA: homing endonuclease [Caudoviricetes sp.]